MNIRILLSVMALLMGLELTNPIVAQTSRPPDCTGARYGGLFDEDNPSLPPPAGCPPTRRLPPRPFPIPPSECDPYGRCFASRPPSPPNPGYMRDQFWPMTPNRRR